MGVTSLSSLPSFGGYLASNTSRTYTSSIKSNGKLPPFDDVSAYEQVLDRIEDSELGLNPMYDFNHEESQCDVT